MSQETSDLLFGVAVTAVFLVFVFALGFVIFKIKNMRFTRVWGPLVPVIQGKVSEDNGGGSTSYLNGTYKGIRVSAAMAPNRNEISGETGFYYNSFQIELYNVQGAQNWSYRYEQTITSLGAVDWRYRDKDKELDSRLRDAGLLALAGPLAAREIRYNASRNSLFTDTDAGSSWIPTPDRFREMLDVMIQIKEVNERVNV